MVRIGITMGCPVGIGPEIVLKYFKSLAPETEYTPLVIGDIGVLNRTAKHLGIDIKCCPWQPGDTLSHNSIPVYSISELDTRSLNWGEPTPETGLAMAAYIETAVRLIQQNSIDAITTCPITKRALQKAGYDFPGHTEMLASLSNTKHFTMMMAGEKLRITLVTIHCCYSDVIKMLTTKSVLDRIRLTHSSLIKDFAIRQPKIAIAGLNPHAGEDGLFGVEESTLIQPAVYAARKEGINAIGPLPPDTVFHKAIHGKYDAVVCMYHDQGLIPFKLIHFHDGVNVTIGLPIVRTSVDHGTAYDIAGRGIASAESLGAAARLAATIINNRNKSC